MIWTQNQLDNLNSNSNEFKSLMNQIFKRLFRVYAHIYHHHFPEIIALGQEPHLNTSLKHFILFAKEFDLIDAKEV